MARTMMVECPEGVKPGEMFEVEIPVPEKKPRGQLAGVALEDMTPEQVKRESINANSVLYKAKQRGASEETIAANQARVDAVNARKVELGIGLKPVGTAVTEAGNLADALSDAGDAGVNEDTAGEI